MSSFLPLSSKSPNTTCLVLHSEHYTEAQTTNASHLESAGLGDVLRRTGWSRLLAANSGCAYGLRPAYSAHGYSPSSLLGLAELPPLQLAGKICSATRSPNSSCEDAIVQEGCSVTLVSDNSYHNYWEQGLACPAAKSHLAASFLALHAPPPLPPSSDRRLHIAIHHRWGDLAAHPNDPRRLKVDDLRDAVRTLQGAAGKDGLVVTLFAERMPETDKPDLGTPYQLVNHDSPVESIYGLAQADVFLAAQSGFTVLPSILSRGLIITNEGGRNLLEQFAGGTLVLLGDEQISSLALESRDRRLERRKAAGA
ncbi:hypothetical protein JCM8547_000164 [Rhodosporidiobolus lusitaniae]